MLEKDNVYVVIGHSELHKDEETEAAVAVAKEYGWQYHVTEFSELVCESIRNNKPDSWYHSKLLLYQRVCDFAKVKGVHTVVDGMILDDLQDYRPGLRARANLGIVSPLIEAKFNKESVRAAAKYLGIESWNKVPSCSLLSRFPYNRQIDLEAIAKVKKVEDLLEKEGFYNSRARYYQALVKIELSYEHIEKFLKDYRKWNAIIKSVGFNNVALDLEGYQTGNMNATIEDKVEMIDEF